MTTHWKFNRSSISSLRLKWSVPHLVLLAVVGSALVGCVQKSNTPGDIVTLTDQVARLREEVTELRDRQQIHDAYLRYMRGFDRNDVELMRAAFWPDVQINYGKQSNTFDEFVSRHLEQHAAQLEAWGTC